MTQLNGLFLISLDKSPSFLSVLHKEPNSNVVLLNDGFEHAAQIWQVRTLKNGSVTLRNLRYNTYISYHEAHRNSPLLATKDPREWTVEKADGANEYYLQARETGLSEDLFASPALILPWPPQTALLPKIKDIRNVWTFHRVLLEGEAESA